MPLHRCSGGVFMENELTEQDVDHTLEGLLEAYKSINQVLEKGSMVQKMMAINLLALLYEKNKEQLSVFMREQKCSKEQLMDAVEESRAPRALVLKDKIKEIMNEMKKGAVLIKKHCAFPAMQSPTAKKRSRMKRAGKRRRMD